MATNNTMVRDEAFYAVIRKLDDAKQYDELVQFLSEHGFAMLVDNDEFVQAMIAVARDEEMTDTVSVAGGS